ncbi:MAG: VPLPA-CTERM sorting domain-containing protein [Syntrophaceae bacterium]|nr:VPLPA-CTERM sorting domain-containing protein [Syntrophaceae bacterium]
MKARKPAAIFIIALMLVLTTTPGFSSTVYFAVDNTLNFDLLDGFDLFTSVGVNPIEQLTLSVRYQSAGGAVPNDIVIPPSTTIKMWDIMLTNYGVYGEKANPLNLQPGVVLMLTGTPTFSLTNIQLLSDDHSSGFYNLPYQIIQTAYLDGTLYTATNAVPIPAAAWLLGSGLIGLVALRRRMRK